MATCKRWTKKGSLEEFWNGAHLEDEEREDLGIPGGRRLQQECEREREREGNWRLGMGRHKRAEKENKFTLGTERCENIKNMYIKNIILIINYAVY